MINDLNAEKSEKKYDLHTHTTLSDGALTPSELLDRAVAQQVDVLAITDHDTTDALTIAQHYCQQQQLPLELIKGVEISVIWQSQEIHIVGLNINELNPLLQQLLKRQQQARYERAEAIANCLTKKKLPISLIEVQQMTSSSVLTRQHFAQYLVQKGIVSNVSMAFNRYLGRGKSAYVPPKWCNLKEAIEVIQAANGQAVLAHPCRYQLSRKWLRKLLLAFKEVGGDGIEVALTRQSRDERRQLEKYAIEYQLLASQGSDFHSPCNWSELGRNLALSDNVVPIWKAW